MMELLGQVVIKELDTLQQSLKQELHRGVEPRSALLVLGAAIILLAIVYWPRRRKAVIKAAPEINDSFKLFKDLTTKLPLNPQQQGLLTQVAREMRLEHPAVLLICAALFGKHTHDWQRMRAHRTRKEPSKEQTAQLQEIRAILFPQTQTVEQADTPSEPAPSP